MKSCFSIGHREASSEILPALRDIVEQHIVEYGVTEYIAGHYGGFDRMAAKAVITAKERHPEITLSMLIPYHPAERPVKLPSGFDNTFYPLGIEKVPRRLAIVRANRYVIDHMDYLIAYVWHPASNARNLLEYARKRKRKNLLVIANMVLYIHKHCLPVSFLYFSDTLSFSFPKPLY